LEITVFFELAKILQKKFRKKYGNNFLFFDQKTLFLGQIVWKKEISEIVLFQTFQKLRKNDVKLKLRKL